MSPWALRCALAGGAAAMSWHVGPAASWLPPVRRRLPALCGRGSSGHIALTFDDGPRPDSTPRVLDVLGELGIRGTFFVLGRALERNPGLAREMAAAGHEVAVHGWDHGYLLGRTRRRVRDELARTRDLIGVVTGVAPSWFRPAYGVLTGQAVHAARELSLRPVLWTAWARDWAATATADSIVARLAPELIGGATVLLHDGYPDPCAARDDARRATAQALPRLASLAAIRGLELGPLCEHRILPAVGGEERIAAARCARDDGSSMMGSG